MNEEGDSSSISEATHDKAELEWYYQRSQLENEIKSKSKEVEDMQKQLKETVSSCQFYDKLRNKRLEESRAEANKYKEELAAAKARIAQMENAIKSAYLSASLATRKLADRGYCFRDGKLKTIQGDQAFTFTTLEAYEELGKLIDEVVYEMMEEAGLQKKYVELGRYRRFLFVSPGYETKKRILCIINDRGEVKAGQWDKSLIINDSLDRGSQLPYIRRAIANGWGVVVLNYSETCEGQQGQCHASYRHALSEWARAFDETSDDAEIVVVAAESDGGAINSKVFRKMGVTDDHRFLAIALINSSFSGFMYAANWKTTKKEPYSSSGVCQLCSGGHPPQGTPPAVINSVFRMLEGMNAEIKGKQIRKLINDCMRILLADSEECAECAKKKRDEDGV